MRRWSLGVAIVLLISAVGGAHAHAALVRSSPTADERLAQSPTSVVLFFDDELDERVSHFALYDSAAKSIAGGEGRVDMTDPARARLIVEKIPPLPEDVYTVRWAVAGTDGDGFVTEGQFDFGVGDVAVVKSTPPVTPIVTSPSSGVRPPTPVTDWMPAGVIGGLALIIAAMGASLLRGSRP